MIRDRIFLKAIAIFMIVETLVCTVAPTISRALTAGPTAPEATSFEPVDTTDMVNLFTGDLAYNTPLLEVPGPNGGYPLSLSYHAGIQPDVEASWVGLGWSLNPGAITRIVNGYADDHTGDDKDIVNHFYWDGETKKTYTLGVTVPIGGGAGVTAGLSFTESSLYGFSVNPFIGGDLSLPGGVGISANSMSGTAQLSAPGLSYLNALDQVKNVVKTGSYDQRITSLGPVSLDVNLSSGGIKPKLTIAGFERGVFREGKVNRVSSKSGINFRVAGIGVNVQRTYTRVWIDETASIHTHGALYFPKTSPSSYTFMDKNAYDTYDLFYDDGSYSAQQKDPQLNSDGSFADYDDFRVNAQGLNGTLRPYHYYQHLLHQNRRDDDKNQVILRSVPMDASGNKVGFRFTNDFSNRFLFDPGVPILDGTPGSPYPGTVTAINMQFNTASITAGLNGEGYYDNILAGSRHIQHYTNRGILDPEGPPEGFIDCTAIGFVRDGSTSAKEQIGSFRITNERGVTYHFALPAHSSSEYSYTEKIEAPSLTYNEVTKKSPYAYTWYLTAITGPDYVDRGGVNGEPNGLLDKNDYGYWVDFGYYKWNGNYYWRNPVEGFNLDLDNNFKSYSYGKKEVYYLKYIRTASHILLFDHSQRLDGRGVTNTSGGYSTAATTSVARLDNIYLLDVDRFNSLGGNNVLDDIPSHRAGIVNSSIRSVGFQYDYSLCRNTPNSFSNSSTVQKEGKLTLNRLEFYGKGGAGSIIPPLKFGYELERPVSGTIFLDMDQRTFSLPNSMFEAGDIIKISQGTSTVYVILNSISGTWKHSFTVIEGGSSSLVTGEASLVQTKNPPYNKDRHDAWGLYKSDFIAGVSSEARITSPLSAKNVDVWSLRTIYTPTGGTIKIDYEADYYDEVVLANSGLYNDKLVSQQALRIKSVSKLPNQQFELFFYDEGYDLSDLFEVDDQIPVYLMGAYKAVDLALTDGPPPGCNCPGIGYAYHDVYDGPATANTHSTVVAIRENTHSIVVYDRNMSNYFSRSSLSTVDYTVPCSGFPDFPSCTYSVPSRWVSFFAGGIAYAENKPKYAGGIRVRNISLINLNKTNRLNYQYGSGVTSYEPISMMAFRLNPDYYTGLTTAVRAAEYQEAEMKLKKYMFKHYSGLLGIVREMPGPGVTYKHVDVKMFVSDETHEAAQEVFQRFGFQTFSKGMLRYNRTKTPAAGGTVADLSFASTTLSTVTLDDLTQAIGNLKSISTYDLNGNLKSVKRYSYWHDDYLASLEDGSGYTAYKTLLQNKINSQGVMNESFSEGRIVRNENSAAGNRYLIGITSKRRTYPSVQIKETAIDYTTGIETTQETQAFDFFSGEETKMLSTDGYGNHFLHEVVPAYTVYPGMGLGMNGKRNMLAQHAAEYAFKIDPTKAPGDAAYKLRVVSASAQTWSNGISILDENGDLITQPAVWRKSRNYQFVGSHEVSLEKDGLYPYSNSLIFNSWDDANVPDTWQKSNEVTLYDIRSNTREVKDFNGIYSANRYSAGFDKIVASASNANHEEFFHSSFEPYGNNEGLTFVNTSFSTGGHTGATSLKFDSSQPFSQVTYKPDASTLVPGRKYMISYWITGTSNNRQNTTPVFIMNGGDIQKLPNNESESKKVMLDGVAWYLHRAVVTVPTNCTSLEVGCHGGYVEIDDLRFQPVDAGVTAYVYNEWGELSYILDNNNLFTKFTYDAMGRLTRTDVETFGYGVKKVNEINYHYANQ